MYKTINDVEFNITKSNDEVIFSALSKIHHQTLKKSSKEAIRGMKEIGVEAEIKQYDNRNCMFSIYVDDATQYLRAEKSAKKFSLYFTSH